MIRPGLSIGKHRASLRSVVWARGSWKDGATLSTKLLIIGDVVGRPGRFVLSQALPLLVEEHAIDLVIVNAENVAGGSGITPQPYEKIIC